VIAELTRPPVAKRSSAPGTNRTGGSLPGIWCPGTVRNLGLAKTVATGTVKIREAGPDTDPTAIACW
jgi:hypothetical protein